MPPRNPGSLSNDFRQQDAVLRRIEIRAKALGVSRQALSSLLNARAGISPDMAVRLSKAFGSSARHWMQLQMNYDLWQAEQRADELDVKRLVSA